MTSPLGGWVGDGDGGGVVSKSDGKVTWVKSVPLIEETNEKNSSYFEQTKVKTFVEQNNTKTDPFFLNQ
jgi:hypothetical protein